MLETIACLCFVEQLLFQAKVQRIDMETQTGVDENEYVEKIKNIETQTAAFDHVEKVCLNFVFLFSVFPIFD